MQTPKNAQARNRLVVACVVLLLVGGVGWLLYSLMSIAYMDTAIGGLREIASSEEKFNKDHPEQGYTCTINQLQFDPRTDWSSRPVRNGVTFALSECDANLPNRTYRATALHPRSDVSAYCSDQSGVVRYEPSRSLEKCLTGGTPI